MRRLLVLLVSVAAFGGMLAPAPAAAFSTANGVRLNAVEARLTYLINQARTNRGIPALTVVPGLTDVARGWSMWQAQHDTLQHNPNLASGITTHGSANWTFAAENVGRAATADSLFAAYMNSPGHRENILNTRVRYLGIGWVERPDGTGYNTQNFVDWYSSTYGRTRTPAVGGLADSRTVTANTSIAGFENGWDPRVVVTRSGSGIGTSGPTFDVPATGDQSVRFAVSSTAVATGGGAELRVRDALDLRNATALRLRLSAKSATGRPVSVQVLARRELGTTVVLGTVTIPSGSWVVVTLPLPSGARNFRNAIAVYVPRSSLDALSSSLSGRSAAVRVADVTALV